MRITIMGAGVGVEKKDQETLPQQAQTIESISGHTYIRKRISLTSFVKKLILWYERPG